MSVEYQIVRECGDFVKTAIDRVESKVKSLCTNGWEPLGGISVCKIDECYNYVVSQAMIRKPR